MIEKYALEKKYDTEEAETKKYVTSCHLKYQTFDDKSVEYQSHEIPMIAHEIINEGVDATSVIGWGKWKFIIHNEEHGSNRHDKRIKACNAVDKFQ
ncbi:hypothetical protein Lal_00026498, partial [Lupinus albus]